MTKLARIALVAALLAGPVLITATPAAASLTSPDDDGLSETIKKLKSQDFYTTIKSVARIVGVGLIIVVISKALFNTAKSGAGLMTAVPVIIVAFVVGGFLINMDVVLSLLEFGVKVVNQGLKAVSEIFK